MDQLSTFENGLIGMSMPCFIVNIFFLKRVDYILVVGSFFCLCIEIGLIHHGSDKVASFRYVAMVRPLKLLR